MEDKAVSGMMLTFFLIGMWGSTFQIIIAPEIGSESIWNMTYGGSNHDVARSVQQTSDGGYIVAGWTLSFGAGNAEFWLIKTNSSGTMQWNKTYGGAGKDEAYSVRQTSDGGYIVAGSTESFGTGSSDFWLVKTNVDGAVQWSKTYGGTSDDFTYSVVQTGDGGYALAGYTNSFGAGSSDFWLVKTNMSGTMQWNKTFGGTGSDRAFSVVQTSDGGYILAGETNSFGAGNLDFWLVKTDSVGTTLWSRTYGGGSLDVARSVKQTSDGEYIVAGWTNSFGAGGSDFWLIKTDGLGNQLWSQTYGDIFDEEAYSVHQTSDGGYVVAGTTTSYGFGGWDFWWVKTDVNGVMRWNQANGGSADERAYSVQQTSDGGYILAGSTESYGAGLADFWVTKNPPYTQRPPEEGHDIAIISVLPSKNLIGEGSSMSINVTVENQGVFEETTMISVYANATLIEASLINLVSAEIATIVFTWNTSGFAKGSYTISAVGGQVLEETDTADNTFVDGKVKVTIIGDVQGDGKVDIFDLFDVGKAFGSDLSESNWNPYCDFNNDNKVDTIDLLYLSENYGQTSN
jgi:uncharacterized delta-60 repeat protein